jgi:hypothetical protein
MTTESSTETTAADGRSIRVIRRLLVVNLALVALQPLSAGFILSGYGRATTVHGVVALALQVGAVIQSVTALVLWLRRRLPGWVPGLSVGLVVIVLLQTGLGYRDWHWLHVPIGVGIFGWLTRQVNRLDRVT